jgi:hypothetical protein
MRLNRIWNLGCALAHLCSRIAKKRNRGIGMKRRNFLKQVAVAAALAGWKKATGQAVAPTLDAPMPRSRSSASAATTWA